MKKRAMKKWIPRNTRYCGNCKWRSLSSKLPAYENGFCKYLEKSDYQLNEIYNKDSVDIFPYIDLHFPTSLLWDGCKECDIGYSIIR